MNIQFSSYLTEIYLHELDGAVEKAMDDLSGKFTQKETKPQPKPATKTRNQKVKILPQRGNGIRLYTNKKSFFTIDSITAGIRRLN